MNEGVSRASARAGTGLAIAARLIWGVTVEAPDALGGGWATVLMSLLFALPALWLLCRLGPRLSRLAPVLLPLALIDAAASVECMAFSESFLAYSHVAVTALILPLGLAMLRCCQLGGDALGASARVWTRVLAAILLVTALCQLPCYHVAWLFPLLGRGIGHMLPLSLKLSGSIALLVGLSLSLCSEHPGTGRVIACAVMASSVAALLVVLQQMMTPAAALLGLPRTVRLDALLANGRAPLLMQLPKIAIWFWGLLHLICFEGWACAALLQRMLHGVPGVLCALAAVGAILALAITRTFVLFPGIGLPLILIAALVAAVMPVKGGVALWSA